MSRLIATVVAILVASPFIFAFALIGVGSAPFVPLMLLTSVGWMHIVQDVAELVEQARGRVPKKTNPHNSRPAHATSTALG